MTSKDALPRSTRTKLCLREWGCLKMQAAQSSGRGGIGRIVLNEYVAYPGSDIVALHIGFGKISAFIYETPGTYEQRAG